MNLHKSSQTPIKISFEETCHFVRPWQSRFWGSKPWMFYIKLAGKVLCRTIYWWIFQQALWLRMRVDTIYKPCQIHPNATMRRSKMFSTIVFRCSNLVCKVSMSSCKWNEQKMMGHEISKWWDRHFGVLSSIVLNACISLLIGPSSTFASSQIRFVSCVFSGWNPCWIKSKASAFQSHVFH